MRLSMLAPTQTCPRGRDIESLKCACAIRIVSVRRVQYSAVPCHVSLAALCPYSSTQFELRYACSSLLCWSSTRGYFIKYVWRRKFLSPSAITTVSWHSRCLTSRLRWISLPFITMQQNWLVPFLLSLPVYALCTREGFEFECCPVGGAIEF